MLDGSLYSSVLCYLFKYIVVVCPVVNLFRSVYFLLLSFSVVLNQDFVRLKTIYHRQDLSELTIYTWFIGSKN
jgi:hypothetical protein